MLIGAGQLPEKPEFDVVIVGAGSAGSAVAGRLVRETAMTVLLVEAGPEDTRDSIRDPNRWPQNLGSDTVYPFVADPEAGLSGRALFYPTGRALGGGGSVNASTWARGHREDWDSYARSTGEERWSYDRVLEIYRRVESYQGTVDHRRGADGPMWIEQPQHPAELFTAILDAAGEAGLPRYDSTNGALMESDSGAAVRDQIIRDGRRSSPFDAYVRSFIDAPALTVLHSSSVAEIRFEGSRAVGILLEDGTEVRARHEVVLAAGAVCTPMLLMRSGIGDEAQLTNSGIPVRQHMPAVGQHLHDHAMVSVVFETAPGLELPAPGVSDIGMFWNLLPTDQDPPVVVYIDPEPFLTDEAGHRVRPPADAVSFLVGVQMRGRGEVRLNPADPHGAPRIRTGFLDRPEEVAAVERAVDRVAEIAAGSALRPYLGRTVYPRAGTDRVDDIRAGAGTFWHQSGTARMGHGPDAVVDSRLHVTGFEHLRIADSSVLPHVTVANTMAPSVVVGETAADLIAEDASA